MKMKWLPMGLVVGLLAMAITGGVAMASGGGTGAGGGDAAAEVVADQKDPLPAKVAEILGTDSRATTDAMARVDAEIEAEHFDAFLEEAVKSGRITAERADAIRAQVKSGDYSGLDQLWLDSYEEECGGEAWFEEPEGPSHQEYTNRIGAILNVDGQKVADAMDQAFEEPVVAEAEGEDRAGPGEGQDWLTARVAEILGADPQATADAMAQVDAEIEAEYVDSFLRQAVESDRITAEQADAIRAQVKSGDYSELDRLWMDSFDDECGADLWTGEPEGVSHQEYTSRIGAILNVDGQKVADAIDQALEELYPEDLDTSEDCEEFAFTDELPDEAAADGAAAN